MEQNQAQRPQRKDFNRFVVIASNGTVVDPQEWKKAVGDKTGKDMKKILKEHHWSGTTVFDQEAYDAAVKTFRESSRTKTQETRKNLFQLAFDEAGVKPHPRIESALRTVLPLTDPEGNQQRVIKALGKIVAAVDSVMVEQPPKKPRVRPDMSKVKNLNENQGDHNNQPVSETEDLRSQVEELKSQLDQTKVETDGQSVDGDANAASQEVETTA